ncbi:MAG TPA: NAD(P)/FAD-dependent oxidoreductase [Solirubrobacteraceae bacterium]|nr:NAD(P)/FAD-dependent oxidoreductase [Solirubrobacteraceae bacterium]
MKRYDAVVVGGGHNGLIAAAYLARAGRSVLVLERSDHVGGAAVSEAPFAGVDARLSRYSYLVSLLPRQIVAELGLQFQTRRRRISSYTPVPGTDRGVLVDTADPARTRASMGAEFGAWQAFYDRVARVARAVFPTMLEPLVSRAELRRRIDDDAIWQALFERPIGETIEAAFDDDVLRGVVLTDALIGTFAGARDPSLRQNRCFLYHVIGNGTGAWDVPVGGMGALTAELARCAAFELRTGCDVTAVEADGQRAVVRWDGGAVECRDVVAGCAPAVLDRLLGRADGALPEGAQLKVNMLLARLPRLRDTAVPPEDAFAGTFHVNETYTQLQAAFDAAAADAVPDPVPCEIYCHSLTDRSILGVDGHTLTLFALHTPARLFEGGDRAGRARAVLDATLRSLNSVLAEPIEDCLLRAPDGGVCLEYKTPLDLDDELALPRGNIFHRDLAWPFAETDDEVGAWGTETGIANVHLGGAGARRGGGVSGIPGRNAAMAVLGRGRFARSDARAAADSRPR